MANDKVLASSHKFILNDITLQEKDATGSETYADDGYAGLWKVNGGGGILMAEQDSTNPLKFILKNSMTLDTLEKLKNFVIEVAPFNGNYATGNKITLVYDDEKTITEIACYNIYTEDKKQEAVSNSYMSGYTDLIEFKLIEDNWIAIINPRVAIWTWTN